MIFENPESPIFGKVDNLKSFGVEFTSKTIQILSDSLYTYKIRAFIRELCCNAVDGHLALEQKTGSAPKYFDVTPPSIMDMQFTLRDYGIGLSDESIYELFGTYFKSSKEQCSKSIGGFGLGSKSPFAYIKEGAFTVTSFYGGEKRVYSMFKKDGMPTICPVSVSKSDEPSGVEIIIPIDEYDIDNVLDELRYVFCTFNPDSYLPNVIGYDDFLFRSDEHDYRTLTSYGFSRTVYAVAGGVAYPIPDEYWRDTIIGRLINRPMFIDFDINEIEPAPSREQLQLTERTVSNIKARIKKHCDELISTIQEDIDKKSDIYDVYKSINEGQYYSRYLWDHIKHKCTYKNKTLQTWYSDLYDSSHSPFSKMYKAIYTQDTKNGLIRSMCGGIKKSILSKDYWDNGYSYNKHYSKPSIERVKPMTVIVVDYNDKKRYNKILELQEIGVIPYDQHNRLLIFQMGCKNRYKIEFAKKKRNGTYSSDEILQGFMKEMFQHYSKDKITTYHVERLYKKHEDVLKKHHEQQKKLQPPKAVKEPTVIKNCSVYHNNKILPERILSNDLPNLTGYYVLTKGGNCYDGSKDSPKYFDMHRLDFQMFLNSKGIPNDKVYIFPCTLEKKALLNTNLTRITFDDTKKVYEELRQKHVTAKDIKIILNEMNISFNIIPELRDEFYYAQYESQELNYLRNRNHYFKDTTLENEIDDIRNKLIEEHKKKIQEFTAKNPLVVYVLKESNYGSKIANYTEAVGQLRNLLGLPNDIPSTDEE